jgi:transcriptional regulator with XRE-family HTH domain
MLIQKLRLQRGWSQEQLAELSGLSVLFSASNGTDRQRRIVESAGRGL